MAGGIRIIAGQWRGRRLSVIDLPGLRPTADRARETLFNWIGPSIRGKRCLDLFAGTGALGLEAASRGAGEVVLVESTVKAVNHLRAAIAEWPGRQRVTIVNADAMSWLAGQDRPFDLIFIDPPYQRGLQLSALQSLQQRGLIAETAQVYVEAGLEEDWLAADPDWLTRHFEIRRERRVGRVLLVLLQLRPGCGAL